MNYSTTKSKNGNDTGDDVQVSAMLLSAGTITGDDVRNTHDEKLGTIEEIMLDMTEGRIRYAVLASGGFLGMGERLFAVPWKAMKLDKENKGFILDVDIEHLKNAPGFDKDQWPNMADAAWSSKVETYYAR